MNTPRFRLYRLPVVALSVVFDCMAPHQVFRLSLISKKSHRITKSLRKVPEKLDVVLSEHASIDIESKDYSHPLLKIQGPEGPEPFGCLKINEEFVRVRMVKKDDDMYIYLRNDRFIGLTHLWDYVRDFYDLPIYGLHVSCKYNSNDPKRALDWVLDRQETIPEVSFECDESHGEEFRYFFDKIENRVTDSYWIDVRSNEDFRYYFRQPLTAKEIVLIEGTWLTIENLYSMNSRVLDAQYTDLQSEDMNSFLKKWQLKGENSNIRFVNLGMEEVDVNEILYQLEVIVREHPNGIKYHFGEKDSLKFEASFELRRNDGTIASIVIDDGEEHFNMCVWPDFHGKPYPVQELKK